MWVRKKKLSDALELRTRTRQREKMRSIFRHGDYQRNKTE